MRSRRGRYSISASMFVALEWRRALMSASRPIRYSCSCITGFNALDFPFTNTRNKAPVGVSSSLRLESPSSSGFGVPTGERSPSKTTRPSSSTRCIKWRARFSGGFSGESGGICSTAPCSCMEAPTKPWNKVSCNSRAIRTRSRRRSSSRTFSSQSNCSRWERRNHLRIRSVARATTSWVDTVPPAIVFGNCRTLLVMAYVAPCFYPFADISWTTPRGDAPGFAGCKKLPGLPIYEPDLRQVDGYGDCRLRFDEIFQVWHVRFLDPSAEGENHGSRILGFSNPQHAYVVRLATERPLVNY